MLTPSIHRTRQKGIPRGESRTLGRWYKGGGASSMSRPAEVMLTKKPAGRRKKLLGDENREGNANRAPNEAEIIVIAANAIEIGMIKGPGLVVFCLAGLPQIPDDVAIGIENADRRGVSDRYPFLAARCRTRWDRGTGDLKT